jgi:4-hydroxy-4-methyl-2-oxoglutarate aldolase
MTVVIHKAPLPGLTAAEIEPWRSVPAAIAADMVRGDGQIDPDIRPLNPPGRQPRLFGRALTALCEPPDFGAVLYAMDVAGPGDVLMIAAGGHRETAMIGEILGGHLRKLGCAGLVCDGAIRDVTTLAGWSDFSVFSRFVTPRGPSSAEKGAVNASVIMGGRLVMPGDLVIGDDDGIVVLSPAMARAHLAGAEKKMGLETEWTASLAGGTSARKTFGLPPPAKR